jgi:hypothetical protein
MEKMPFSFELLDFKKTSEHFYWGFFKLKIVLFEKYLVFENLVVIQIYEIDNPKKKSGFLVVNSSRMHEIFRKFL